MRVCYLKPLLSRKDDAPVRGCARVVLRIAVELKRSPLEGVGSRLRE
jgi:hypothetical protein